MFMEAVYKTACEKSTSTLAPSGLQPVLEKLLERPDRVRAGPLLRETRFWVLSGASNLSQDVAKFLPSRKGTTNCNPHVKHVRRNSDRTKPTAPLA
jgi:hypothetical protein